MLTRLGGVVGVMLLGVAEVQGAVVPLAYYQFGDKPGDTNGVQPTIGTQSWTRNGATAVVTGGAAPWPAGNNSYTTGAGAAGFYGINTNADVAMPTDNWGIELIVRSSAVQNIDIFTVNGVVANGNLKFTQINSNWAASYHNVAWIGASSGTGQAATIGEWTHLAVVRAGGVSTFYINGVARTGTTTATPVWGNSGHLSVLTGGGSGWSGDNDDMRFFTFTPGNFNPATDLLIPEPAGASLIGLSGAVALLRRSRRRC